MIRVLWTWNQSMANHGWHVRWRSSGMNAIHEEGDFECYSSMCGKPVQLFQCWCYMFSETEVFYCPFWTSLLIIGCVIRQCIVYYCIVNVRLFDDKTKVIYWLTDWLIEGSTTILLRTFRIQTFRLLLFTSVYDSYTSNFCFCKSLFSSIPTSTYTMIPFYQSRSHLHYDNTTHWISRIVAWESRLYFQLNMFYFHQSHF